MKPVWLMGVPRSGTSWAGALLDSSPRTQYRFQPLFSYAFKDAIDEHATAEQLSTFLGSLSESEDLFVRYGPQLAPQVDFAKETPSHLVIKETRYMHVVENVLCQMPEAKLVGLIRHPLAVLASWRKAPREFRKDWNWETEWRFAPSKNAGKTENVYGYEAWKQTALMFIRLMTERPSQVTVCHYSDLLADTERELERLFSFCGLPIEGQTLEFVRASRARNDGDPYGVFRTARPRDDRWKEDLDRTTIETVYEDLSGTELAWLLEETDS